MQLLSSSINNIIEFRGIFTRIRNGTIHLLMSIVRSAYHCVCVQIMSSANTVSAGSTQMRLSDTFPSARRSMNVCRRKSQMQRQRLAWKSAYRFVPCVETNSAGLVLILSDYG